ncbi:unnamed protein product [Rhodiola kirilowii]
MVRSILIRGRSFCSSPSQYSSVSAANQTNPRCKLSSLFLPHKPESVVDVNEAISFFDAMISSQRPNSIILQSHKLLAIVIQNGRYYDAIQMYRKLEVIQLNINTISMLVNCYSKVSCIDYGFGMLGLILKRGLSPNVIFFTTLVKGLCFQKRVEEAGWLLCRMEEIGCSPDEVMWQTFYGGLCSLGNLDLAVHLCDKLAGKLYADSAIVMQLISVCHGVAIHHLIEKGLVVKAEQLMVEMRQQRIVPYLFAYHSFIYFWCCAQEMEKAINMLSEMKYYDICPTAVTYNMIIHGFCQAGQFEEARCMIHEMKNSALFPDVITYTCLINGFCRACQFEKAWHMFTEMKTRGPDPNVVTYTCLIDGLCRAGEFEEAWHMFTEMKIRGPDPNVVTYTCLIHGLCRAGELEEAWHMFTEMKTRGPDPDVVTYNCLIHGLCRAGELQEAWRLFTEMKTRGPDPNVVTYTCLIHGLCRVGQFEKAWHMFTEMKIRGPDPDVVTYTCLIHGLCRVGQFEKAWHMFTEMKTRGPDPNVVTYTCLIHGLCRVGQFEKAWLMFTEMKTRGSDPNVVTYNCLIHGLCRAGELEEAWHMFTEMKTRGPNPDVVTYNSIINGFFHAGSVGRAQRLFHEMKADGVSPDDYTYNSIIRGLCKVGDWMATIQTFTQMLEQGVKPNYITLDAVRNARLKESNRNEETRILYLESAIEDQIVAAAERSRRSSTSDRMVKFDALCAYLENSVFRKFDARCAYLEYKPANPNDAALIKRNSASASKRRSSSKTRARTPADRPSEENKAQLIGHPGGGPSCFKLQTSELPYFFSSSSVFFKPDHSKACDDLREWEDFGVRGSNMKLTAGLFDDSIYSGCFRCYKDLQRFKRNCLNFGSLIEKSNKKLSNWEDIENGRTLILKRGLDLGVIFFTTLVKGLCLEKRVEEAGWLLCRMEEIGCSPDEFAGKLYADSAIVMQLISVCHSVAIHYLIEKGLVVEVELLMDEMRRKGIVPYLCLKTLDRLRTRKYQQKDAQAQNLAKTGLHEDTCHTKVYIDLRETAIQIISVWPLQLKGFDPGSSRSPFDQTSNSTCNYDSEETKQQ